MVRIVLELSTGASGDGVSLSLASDVVVLVLVDLIEIWLLLDPGVVVREILIL